MEMRRHEDWVLENIDYQFLDEEDLKATSLLTGANSSQFLKSLPLEAPQVPLRTLFAELHDVRSLMSELGADSALVTISLDLPEIGVRGEAVVTGVEPCPVILPGPGKVVLTTFHHASSHLIDLYLSPQLPTRVNSQANTYLTSTSNSATHPLTTLQTSEEALLYPQASRSSNMDPSWERIGVTGNHPIWSEDRHDYIAAMDLRVGERLKNLSGDTVYVQQKLPRPGPTPVYNLEVQDEHVYYVGTNGVLAHNVGKNPTGKAKFDCGAYQEMRGSVPELDAHHAGQSAAMKKVVAGYDHETAPTILVPKVGHTIKGPNGIVSRSTKGLNNARDIVARDVRELRRVYPDIPNAKLKELIDMSKRMYREMKKKRRKK
jgi:hypothetical protein